MFSFSQVVFKSWYVLIALITNSTENRAQGKGLV